MKTIIAVLFVLTLSSVASAQNPDTSKWMCRTLADSGGFLYQGETVFGTQACRPIPQTALAQPAVSPALATPKQDTDVAPAAAAAPVAASATPAMVQPSAAAPTTEPQPTVLAQNAGLDQRCLIVRQAEGHRFRNSMIAGALTGGIGFAVGAASGGAKYEYVDSFHFANTKLKYDGKELQKLQDAGVHVVTVSKKATGDEIKDARESCRE